MSQDATTGEQTYKPVIQTFTTHPDALYHLQYDPDGPGPLPQQELVTTALHPFWVINADAFVAAEDLKLGDQFLLADGGTAELLDIEIEEAASGNTFTTYNFEAADFHTYFVGTNGVWVHNAAGRECERITSLFRRVMAKYTPDDPVASYKYVREKLNKMSDVAHTGLTDDVLKELEEMKNLGTLNERLIQLGIDLDNPTKWKAGEVFAARRYELKTGRTLRRPRAGVPLENGADFVDTVSGQLWQVKGPFPSLSKSDQIEAALESWFRDRRRGEKLMVELAGCPQPQREAILAALKKQNPAGDLFLIVGD